jgi:hypothetical protein
MGARGPINPLRDYVVGLYRRGDLATLDEGATIAATSRSRVHAWLQAEGIAWQRARQHFIARHCRKATDQAEGKQRRRPTKAELREQGARLIAQWEAKRAAKLEEPRSAHPRQRAAAQ